MTRKMAFNLIIGILLLGLVVSVPQLSLRATPIDPCSGVTLAYYPMNEGVANVIHDICNGYDGAWTQGVTWATDTEGSYLQFSPGSGPRITVNAATLSNNTAITVELRMMPGTDRSSPLRVISQMGAQNAGQLRFTLDYSGSRLQVWGATGSQDFWFCGAGHTGCLPAGQWTHVAFQIQNTQVWLYYNGVLVASGTLPHPQTLRATGAITEIGTGESIFDFDGKIQYVRVSYGIRSDFLLARPIENELPAANAGGPYTGLEGGTVVLDGSGSTDPDSDPLTFSWDLDNNGTFETPGQNPSFSGTDRDGPDIQPIALQVCDDSNACDIDQTTIEILNVAPTADFVNTSGIINIGEAAMLVFSNQFDPSTADTTAGFFYSYDCTGAGSFLIVDSSFATFSCSYSTAGTFTAIGRIKDKDGGFTDYQAEAIVNAPPVADDNSATTDEDVAVTIDVLANDTDPDGDPLTITDVGPATSGMAMDNGNGTVTYTPNLNYYGADSFGYTVSDGKGGTAVATVNVTVQAVNDPPTVSVNSSRVTVPEGEQAQNTGTVGDVDGDVVTLTASIGMVTNNGDGTWTWTYTTTDGPSESQTVTITADDLQADPVPTTFELVVENVAPRVTPVTDITINPAETALVRTTFTDPGVPDTHTATIDWGDGTLEPATVDQTTKTVTASHHYIGGPQQYSVSLCVVDNDGHPGPSCMPFVVTVQGGPPSEPPGPPPGVPPGPPSGGPPGQGN